MVSNLGKILNNKADEMIHVSEDTRREESVGLGSLDHLVFFSHHFLAAFTGMRNILWGWPSIQAR